MEEFRKFMNTPGKFMNISEIISNFCNKSLSQNHTLNARNWQISQNGEYIYTKISLHQGLNILTLA